MSGGSQRQTVGRADSTPGGAALPSVAVAKVRIPSAPSMPLERLDALLGQVWQHRLALIVAPAGSGKTTLAARFAIHAPGPVGWYRAEAWDREEPALLRHLGAAIAPVLGDVARGWSSVAEAANALDAWAGEPILLVVDDLHTIAGTPAETALERLIEYAPASLTVLAATRVPPGFNLPRLRVSGVLLEIGGDDLRFRSWEVERLFRDFYREPLPPEELARLARRTEGWAAGLQLFHLATRGKPAEERRRVLTALGPSSRLMRDYLSRNVLEALPEDLRRFLVDTSVLGRLSAALCDALLDSARSAEHLADLERRNLFTQALPEDGAYRYHEVLRAYLRGVLLAELGEARLRERFRAAGRLLAEAGAHAEALEAYVHAGDGDAARRLLGTDGEALVGRSGAWVEALPAMMLLHDPWLLLASARQFRAEGRFAAAVERYERAERAFGSLDPADVCRDERQALTVWLDPARSPRRDPSALLRAAVRRDPLATVRDGVPEAGTGTSALAQALATLLAGNVRDAQQRLSAIADDEGMPVVTGTVAALAGGVAALLGGDARGALGIQGAVAAAESLGLEWLARLGRASLALSGRDDALREAEAVAAGCAAAGDSWGDSLARLAAAWGRVGLSDPRPEMSAALEVLMGRFRALDAPVLEAWTRGLAALALARGGAPDAHDAAIQSEAVGRNAGVAAVRMLTALALLETTGDAAYGDQAEAIARETGLVLPSPEHGSPTPVEEPVRTRLASVVRANGHAAAPTPPPPLRIRLLGGFELELDGQPVDLSPVRPRVRALLRLLCLHAGSPVHHETIEAALWPAADADGGSRNLHVAVAAVRRAVEPMAGRGSFQLVRREGHSYRLALPAGTEVDLHRFEAALLAGRAARERRDPVAATSAFEAAVGAYAGELLPEDGPAEWVVERREVCRLAAVEAAQALAELLLAAGDAAGAARASAGGLGIERYHDPLWRLLIEARDRAGDQAAAMRARSGYDRVLAELGVSGAP